MLIILGFTSVGFLIAARCVKDILNFRRLNVIGWILLIIYGLFIHSYPVIVLGIFCAGFNLYYIVWVKLGKGSKFFRHQYDVSYYGKFCTDFVKFHMKELNKYFPDVEFNKLDEKNLHCGFVFRDMTPVGLFIYKKLSNDSAEIIVDYIEHRYVNLSEACFLTRGKSYLKKNKGINQLITYTAVPSHVKYLEKQGFTRDSEEVFKFVLNME